MSAFANTTYVTLSSAGNDRAERPVKLRWHWDENEQVAGGFGGFVDVIVLLPKSHQGENERIRLTPIQINQSPFAQVLAEILDAHPNESTMLSLFIPRNDGYVIRSDLFQERLRGSQYVRQTWSFVQPLQQHSGQRTAGAGFKDWLNAAMGAAWLQGLDPSTENYFEAARADLTNRLSLPWISTTPVVRKTVAIFGEPRTWERSERFYLAARALGIDIVAFERPNHWLNNTDSAVAAFVPFDVHIDETFVKRATQAIQSYTSPIHGVVSAFNTHHGHVALVAESLGLPTSSSSAVAAALDKFKARQLDGSTDGCALVHSVEEVDQLLADQEFVRHGFPRIVKPSLGWDSEEVSKVMDETQLRDSIQRALNHKAHSEEARHSLRDHSETAVLVEPYCEGPEVDANFVLWKGKVLFFEAVDNFPCPGDTSAAPLLDGFLEEQSMLPSALPSEETSLLRDALHDSLLRIGFHSGMFHVEARVKNSHHAWSRGPDGHLDLRPHHNATGKANDALCSKASSFLIEVNPRPPGYWDSVASAFTNGVDYYAQQLLCTVGDIERFCNLAIPFVNGPQFFCTPIPILVVKGGILAGDPSSENLQRLFPDLSAHIIKYQALYRTGDVIPEPGGTRKPYLSIVLLFSRVSRTELFDVVKEFRGRVRDEIGRVE